MPQPTDTTPPQLRDYLAINTFQIFAIAAAKECDCLEDAIAEYHDRLLDRTFDDPDLVPGR